MPVRPEQVQAEAVRQNKQAAYEEFYEKQKESKKRGKCNKMCLAFSSFFAYDNNHSNISEKASAQSKKIRICHNINHTELFQKKYRLEECG